VTYLWALSMNYILSSITTEPEYCLFSRIPRKTIFKPGSDPHPIFSLLNVHNMLTEMPCSTLTMLSVR